MSTEIYAIIEIATGESMKVQGDEPAIFDSRTEAENWAVEQGYTGREFAIEQTAEQGSSR